MVDGKNMLQDFWSKCVYSPRFIASTDAGVWHPTRIIHLPSLNIYFFHPFLWLYTFYAWYTWLDSVRWDRLVVDSLILALASFCWCFTYKNANHDMFATFLAVANDVSEVISGDATLPKTNNIAPENRPGPNRIETNRFPTIYFQVRTRCSFQGGYHSFISSPCLSFFADCNSWKSQYNSSTSQWYIEAHIYRSLQSGHCVNVKI